MAELLKADSAGCPVTPTAPQGGLESGKLETAGIPDVPRAQG